MSVKPFTWMSWWNAQRRMSGEICSGWEFQRDLRDEALVNSLSRLNVPYCRGNAYDSTGHPPFLSLLPAYFTPVPLKEVLSGLKRINKLDPSRASVEFETTQWEQLPDLGVLPLGRRPLMHQVKKTRTALITEPFLAWEPLRDDLIKFAVPNGWKLNRPNNRTAEEDEPQQRVPHTTWLKMYKLADTWMKTYGRPERGDGGQAKLENYMAEKLSEEGYTSTTTTIRRHAKHCINKGPQVR